MSDSDSSKSMDDVLASIRRIVRTERQSYGDTDFANQEPRGDVKAAVTGDDAPLELTAEMLMGSELEDEDPVAATASDAVAQPVAEPENVTASTEPTDEIHTSDTPPAMDPDAIETMVRAAVREFLATDDGDALIRNIIRDELVNGEIGGNISENVMQLISSEVASAMKP